MALPPLSSLTLRGRARRLRRVAEAALPAWPLQVRRLRLLSNSWNCVFRVDADEGTYALRVGLPDQGMTIPGVQSEAAVLEALVEAGFEVPRPIRARDGRAAVVAGAPGVEHDRICFLTSWIPGRDLAAEITPARWAQHGALHARLHRFAATWTPPELAIGDFTHTFHFENSGQSWPDAELFGHEALFAEALAATDARIAAVRRRDPVIVTHGDLHHANVKLHRGVLRAIDFEDAMWATPLQDVATSLYYVSKRGDFEALRDAFADGYAAVAPWVEAEDGEVEALLFARGMVLLEFLAADLAVRSVDWRNFVERIATLARRAL